MPPLRALGSAAWLSALLAALCGCGTTKWSDTSRTATEQLLISDAVDRAVSEFDFSVLAGRNVYFDNTYLKGSVDENYVVSSLRQHLLASGCYLMETREAADYVVEARAGAVGTDRSDLLFGVPSVNVPSVPGLPVAVPSSIPEIPLAKTTNQKAVAKLAVFAYNRRTGRPVLQTGTDPSVSTARNSWLFGAGPFRRGTIYDQHQVLDNGVDIPIIGGREQARDYAHHSIPVTAEAVFPEPAVELATKPETATAGSPVAKSPSAPVVESSVATATVPLNPSAAAAVGATLKLSPPISDPQIARLPEVDRSGIGTAVGASSAGVSGSVVQRAQFTEPANSKSPPTESANAAGGANTAAQDANKRSSWSIFRPSTWFGK